MKSLIATLFVLLIAGCAESQIAAHPAVTARQAIEQAQARYRDSQTAGHAWLQTKVRLKNANEALQAEDFTAARTEAERALALAEASLAQAQAEQNAWRERFPVAPPK